MSDDRDTERSTSLASCTCCHNVSAFAGRCFLRSGRWLSHGPPHGTSLARISFQVKSCALKILFSSETWHWKTLFFCRTMEVLRPPDNSPEVDEGRSFSFWDTDTAETEAATSTSSIFSSVMMTLACPKIKPKKRYRIVVTDVYLRLGYRFRVGRSGQHRLNHSSYGGVMRMGYL